MFDGLRDAARRMRVSIARGFCSVAAGGAWRDPRDC
jgi:hypothetical protein